MINIQRLLRHDPSSDIHGAKKFLTFVWSSLETMLVSEKKYLLLTNLRKWLCYKSSKTYTLTVFLLVVRNTRDFWRTLAYF